MNNLPSYVKIPFFLFLCAIVLAMVLVIFSHTNANDKVQLDPLNSSVPSVPCPIVFDNDIDARFSPPSNWNPLVEKHLETEVPAAKLEALLHAAYIAKRGLEYSEKRPIQVSSKDGVVIVRFPADTNAPSGFRYRGPEWAATVIFDSATMRILSVLEDPN